MGIFLSSFHKLGVDLLVHKTSIERNYSLDKHQVVWNRKTKCTSQKGPLWRVTYSTSQHIKSNSSCFKGKTEAPGKKKKPFGAESRTNLRMASGLESNPGHIDEGRVLPPLHQSRSSTFAFTACMNSLSTYGKKRNSVTVPVSAKASTSSSSLVDSLQFARNRKKNVKKKKSRMN